MSVECDERGLSILKNGANIQELWITFNVADRIQANQELLDTCASLGRLKRLRIGGVDPVKEVSAMEQLNRVLSDVDCQMFYFRSGDVVYSR